MPDTDAAPVSSESTPVTDGAAVSAESSAGSQEQEGPSLLERMSERLFGRRDQQGKPVASTEPATETKPTERPSTAQRRQYSDDEFARAVQAETDRRESKRTAEQREADKKRLRDEDPYAYVDQEKLEEQQRQSEEQFRGFLSNIGQQYDQHVLDPVMERLSAEDKTALFADESMGAGLEGRKALMGAAIEKLLGHARAEGERAAADKLRKNSAFRKQLLSEFRGSDEHQEPDLIPANGGVGDGRDMNNFIRASLNRGRYRPPQ